MRKAYCYECGEIFAQTRHDACFCKTACRRTYHNRAMVRGEALYHLFRVMRRERDLAKQLGVWKEMCRVEFAWNEEDKNRPEHSRRWNHPGKHLTALTDTGRLMRGDVVAKNYRAAR